MIGGRAYLETVKLFFAFLITEFGFKLLKETADGSVFYEVEYTDSKRTVPISYEHIGDYLELIVFKLQNGMLPDYDDKAHTLHLQALNKLVFAKTDKAEMNENNTLFDKFHAVEEIEKKLLKCAKELRLVLRHWDSVQSEMIK